jgi:hypothetical protein
MDLLSRMREEVPLGVSPHAEQLFRTALLDSDNPDRATWPHRRRGARVTWRPVFVLSLAAAAATAVAVTVLPSPGQAPGAHQAASGPAARGQVPPAKAASPVQLLAARAAAAALSGPNVTPGQWVYRETEMTEEAGKLVKSGSEELWSTADDNSEASYYNGKLGIYYRDRNNNGVMGALDFFPVPLRYRSLGSLPAQPAALVKRLAAAGVSAKTGEPVGCSQSGTSCTAFLVVSELLSSYVMPPATTAKLYRALGAVPGVKVVPNVVMAGQRCTGFRIPLTGGYLELLINSSTYQFVGSRGLFPGQTDSASVVTRQALVSGPGVRP